MEFDIMPRDMEHIKSVVKNAPLAINGDSTSSEHGQRKVKNSHSRSKPTSELRGKPTPEPKGKPTPELKGKLKSIPSRTQKQNVYSVAWQRNAVLVQDFVSEFGRLPSRSKASLYHGVDLGCWIRIQQMVKNGKRLGRKLTPDQVHKLEIIPGWFWELDLDAAWQQNADLLRKYVAEFGRLPTYNSGIYHDINLGEWICHQRQGRKGHRNINPDQKQELEAIPGWYWELDLDTAWQPNADLLREYVAEFGCLPSKRSGSYRGVNLGSWIRTQRKVKRGICKGKLTPERERELESIPGWVWGITNVHCVAADDRPRARVREPRQKYL